MGIVTTSQELQELQELQPRAPRLVAQCNFVTVSLTHATLFSTAQSLDPFRDQHHAAARSGLRAPDHFYDYDAAPGKQCQPRYSLKRRFARARQSNAGPDNFHRSPGNDPVQQRTGRCRDAPEAADGIEASEPGRRRRHPPRSRIAGAKTDRADGYLATRANHESGRGDESGNEIGDAARRTLLAQRPLS